jgi:flavorubredoxin
VRNIVVFESDNHKFILLNESEPGEEDGIRSNQYLILHEDSGVLLDPGGFGVMPRALAELLGYIGPDNIKGIILSHQDPDIVGGLATWLELTSASVYVSRIWMRFLPHYGIKSMQRFVGVPDHGMALKIDSDFALQLVPAHFLHSEGQINVYDPVAKILFTGDIGAAMLPLDEDYAFVDDFAAHLPYIEDFHRRYMCGNRAIRAWVDTISTLDIQILAPQHGPIYRGAAVRDFLAWFGELECGLDIMSAGGTFRAR